MGDDATDKIVIAGLFDLDLNDASRAGLSVVDVDGSVDIGSLSCKTAFEKKVAFFGDAFDDHLDCSAKIAC